MAATEPYTFAEATKIVEDARRVQQAAEETLRGTSRDFAQKERAYRMALAEDIVRQHSEGVAWTVCQDLARGDRKVAQLRMERDIAEGVREAVQQQLWRAAADRRDVTQLIQWSMRRDLAEGYGDVAATYERPIGAAR